MTLRPTSPISISWDAGPSGTKSYDILKNGTKVATQGNPKTLTSRISFASDDDLKVVSQPSGQVQECVISWVSGSPTPPPTHNRFFVDNAYINTPVGSNPAFDSRSDTIMQTIISACSGGIYANDNAWSTPIYQADSTTPLITVTLDPYTSPTGTVHVPYKAGWQSSPDGVDGDHHYTVMMPDGSYWTFQGFNESTFKAHSYATGNVKTGNGIPTSGRVAVLDLLAGMILPGEVAAGVIDHGIRLAFPCGSNTPQWPAVDSDGDNPNGPNGGMQLWLPPNITSSDPFVAMVCVALNKYGGWNSDENGGSSAALYCESLVDGSTYPIPRTTVPLSILRQMKVLAPAVPH